MVVATVQGFLIGIPSWSFVPSIHPWKSYLFNENSLMNFRILGNLQYRQFWGHSIATSKLLVSSWIKRSKAFHNFFIVLTCFMTFLAALGIFKFTWDHDVPPVQGRLSHNRTSWDTGKSFTMLATYVWYSLSSRLCFSVNWITLHPTAASLETSLNLDMGLQQISTSKRLGFRPALGSPELRLDAIALGRGVPVVACAESEELVCLPLDATWDMRVSANRHFSALVNGFVRMSATCIFDGPYVKSYHPLLYCSDNHDKLIRWVLSVWRKEGDLPFSKILMVAWLSSTKIPRMLLGGKSDTI